jgi:hypothetical protein
MQILVRRIHHAAATKSLPAVCGPVGGGPPLHCAATFRGVPAGVDGSGSEALQHVPMTIPLRCAFLVSMLPALLSIASAEPASAPSSSARPIEYGSVAQALAALKRMDGNGTIVTESDGWVIVNEPAAAAQWSFPPSGHDAYPAVVRRVIRRPAGAPVTVETASLCEASADACVKLLREFEALNERITQAVRARGRQGSTQP